MSGDPSSGDAAPGAAPGVEDRVAELFFEVEGLSPGEARDHLEKVCGAEPELVEEVLSLREFSPLGEQLVGGLLGEAFGWLEGGEEPVEGRIIGSYRILRELGRGGLGRVFLAERLGGDFQLEVALKVIDRVLASAQEKARFEQERRILASLSHPHIAQIFDGGSTADGTPFFVMERVPGVPVDRYCEDRGLGVEERIRVFLKIADAVAYAHRNLVIHRDLKPSNILVTPEGAPKLLDFGIATTLEGEGPSALAGRELTRTGELLLTPEYASPEQVQGRPLSTATDVYSLGALLFRLLTGAPPHRFDSHRPAEIERAICERPAPLASQSLGAAAGPGDARELARLRKTLRGDLDGILATALAREPERRYASVELLARDLGAYLEGLPVSAQGDSLAYRSRIFVRRNRLAVAAGALILLSLLAGLISTSRALGRSRVEQARTAQVADFMVELFEAADPAVARGEEITARQLLDQGAKDLLRRDSLEPSPEVRSTLLATIGRVYRQLGLYPQAEELLRESLALRRRRAAGDGPEVAEALNDLGQLYDAWEDHERALSHLEEALALTSTRGGGHQREREARATTRLRLASVELDLHHYEEALFHLEEALEIRRRLFPARSPEVAEVRHSRAQVWYRQQQLEEARGELEAVLELRRSLLGEDHPLVLTTYNDLATVLHDEGDLEAALGLLQRTVEARRRLLGAEHPYVATVLQNLATVARKSGDLELAASSLEEALAINRAAFGDSHPRIAENLDALARLAQLGGRLEEAQELYGRALEMRRSVLGPEHLDVARSLLALGDLHRLRSRPRRAEALYRQGLSIQEKVLGPEDLRLGFLLVPLGRLLTGEGRPAEAVPLLERALTLRQGLDPSHRLRAEAEAELGLALAAAGGEGLASAREHLETGYAVFVARDGAETPYVRRLAAALESLGDQP